MLSASTLATRVQYEDRSIAVAEVLLLLGTLALDADDLQASGRWSRESAERFAEACAPGEGCPSNYGTALTLQGEHALRSSDPRAAAAFFRAAIDAYAPIAEAREQRADNMLLLAEALADAGDVDQARAWLTQASDQFTRQGREAEPELLSLTARLSR